MQAQLFQDSEICGVSVDQKALEALENLNGNQYAIGLTDQKKNPEHQFILTVIPKLTFSGVINFYSVEFLRRAYFRSAVFSELADFRLAKSSGLTFPLAKFSKKANFRSAVFSD